MAVTIIDICKLSGRCICSLFAPSRLLAFTDRFIAPLVVLLSLAAITLPLAVMEDDLGGYISVWGVMAIGGFWARPADLSCGSLAVLLCALQTLCFSTLLLGVAHFAASLTTGGYAALWAHLKIALTNRPALSFFTSQNGGATPSPTGEINEASKSQLSPPVASDRTSQLQRPLTFKALTRALLLDVVMMAISGIVIIYLITFYRNGFCGATFVPMRDTFILGYGFVAIIAVWGLEVVSVLVRTLALVVWSCQK
eukprot:GILI01024102.1.p1 GENE.GILI01024102.1~~GILI01024102.1.p1  ORF type:complete len:254 (-),score=17.10 GILI01024102.1:28-789(-)